MLLLPEDAIEDRRQAARTGGPLEPLYLSLASELEPLIGVDPFIPAHKALLSRAGGRCEADNTALEFDPWSPHEHRCPRCGRMHQGELHDRAWIMSYQLWLAERAVHAALLHLLRGGAAHAALASDILGAYAERYPDYPNTDNVLGPSRLFFSTYLESIWLLQIGIATDLVERNGDRDTANRVRDRVLEPGSAMIAEYDEGMSNRQVWNNAALLASASLCRHDNHRERLIHGSSGVLAHLSRALLSDGSWYEGENYHQFALRGLWYGVAMLEANGDHLPPAIGERFQRSFAAPFLTALPDFTMPSRKDSQFAVSLRQWRFAEMAELGFARREDAVLADALARCYESGHAARDTGRARSTADIERNGPSSRLTRADLGWRALLHAVPALPPLNPLPPRSAHMEAQGYAAFRREPNIYVGFDYGQSGGGHGHPDRLNLTLYEGTTRWLDDLGTGSYLDHSLHWYRSTLAHNAPLVDGTSQPIRDGTLIAYDEREGLGWIVGEFTIPEREVRLERTVLVAPDYLIDELRWTSAQNVRVELPWHVRPLPRADMVPAVLDGGAGIEDGFSFVSDAVTWGGTVAPIRDDGQPGLPMVLHGSNTTVFSALGPAQPATTSRRFVVVRAHGPEGCMRAVISWTDRVTLHVAQVDGEERLTIEARRDERHVHRRDESGWHVELLTGSARSSIDLSGFRAPVAVAAAPGRDRTPLVPLRIHRSRIHADWLSALSLSDRATLLVYELGEAHYRRSELDWRGAGSPHATIAITADDQRLVLYARVNAGDLVFASRDATNAFDNEQSDTMRAGLQLYLGQERQRGAWMLIPEARSDRVRTRVIPGWVGIDTPLPEARWREVKNGYEMRIQLSLPALKADDPVPIGLDVLINEATADRVRRRGQLVMSGARGEWVYLRGDRHDPARLIPLVVVP